MEFYDIYPVSGLFKELGKPRSELYYAYIHSLPRSTHLSSSLQFVKLGQ